MNQRKRVRLPSYTPGRMLLWSTISCKDPNLYSDPCRPLNVWYNPEQEVLVQRQQEYTRNPKSCKHCARPLAYPDRFKTFCGHSCSATYSNLRRGPMGKSRCACGYPIPSRHVYCRKCKPPKKSLLTVRGPKARRLLLIAERGHACEVCGLSSWRGESIPLEVDHINGNADDNSPDNLRLICPNCHALTPTYKGRNRGVGSSRQKRRMQRYRDGKTY